MELNFSDVHVLEQSEGAWSKGIPGKVIDVSVSTIVFTTSDLKEYHGDDPGDEWPGHKCRVMIANHNVDGARHWRVTVFDTVQEIRFTTTTTGDPQEALQSLVGRLEELSAEYWYHNAKLHMRVHAGVTVDNWLVKPDGRLDGTNNLQIIEEIGEQSSNGHRI